MKVMKSKFSRHKTHLTPEIPFWVNIVINYLLKKTLSITVQTIIKRSIEPEYGIVVRRQ